LISGKSRQIRKKNRALYLDFYIDENSIQMKQHAKDIDSFPKRLDKIKSFFLSLKLSNRTIFILMGIAATIWFLVRVIPKPQRAYYPCMRAAAPIMSGFIIYLFSLGGSVVYFRKSLSRFRQAHYKKAFFLAFISFVLLAAFAIKDARNALAASGSITFTRGVLPDGPNNPMGTGFGIFPGRVAWIMNKAATNENCKDVLSDAFFMAENNNQDTINKMADNGIKLIGGNSTVKGSWGAIFRSFNKKKTGTESDYSPTQTIFIKINNGQAGWAINSSDLSETGVDSSTGVSNAAISETTPATVLAIVRQLVDSCNIPQEKIYVSEPMTHVYKSTSDIILDKYPKVKILDKENYTSLGRTTSTGWTEKAIVYSDKGDVMPDAIDDAIINEMYNADYQINIAALKAHARTGVTLCAKQHFGSHGDHGSYGWGSFYLHDGLICVDNDAFTSTSRVDYHSYRVLTDLMGHEKLGRNTLLFIVDGLWGGIESTDMAVKWKTAPFNNNWPNSLFMSQDEVAVESVCIDFLRSEANSNTAFKDRPFFPAVDDYLHQAADRANWPDGIIYDPEGDGTPMPSSLGVHEHWNNNTKKQYSKDLNPNGKGIDLVSFPSNLVQHENVTNSISGIKYTSNLKLYPNPCTYQATLSYQLTENARINIDLVSLDGRIMKHIKHMQLAAGAYMDKIDANGLRKGFYICRIAANNELRTIKLEIK